ncbi:MAG: NDP-sugar synthase [Bacteroidales bacterium]
MKTTLLVLAAGMGSRYGGMKQLDHLGPSGETIMDYSIYDALKAGFNKIVFVIRHSFEKEFREMFIDKLEGKAEIQIAYQEMDNIPAGIEYNRERTKPWGTTHAIWVAKDLINEPFAVINADDFYGRESFSVMADFLKQRTSKDKGHYAMVGYKLKNTLSEHGTVSRGICSTRENTLENVEEHTNISRDVGGKVMNNQNGQIKFLNPEATVSMNFWGFTPDIFIHLENRLNEFLKAHARDLKTEAYIPFLVDELVKQGKAHVEVLHCDAQWFGVTYYKDKFMAMDCINELVKKGAYPRDLWSPA